MPLRILVLIFLAILVAMVLMLPSPVLSDDGYKSWDRPTPDPSQPTPTPMPTATPVSLAQQYPVKIQLWSRPFDQQPWNTGYCQLLNGYGWSTPLRFPTDGTLHQSRLFRYTHRAIDIDAIEGTNIYAAAAGVVVWSGRQLNGYTNLIVLAHGAGYQTLYAHVGEIFVECGQHVRRGAVIGLTWGQMSGSSWPHLHFEVRNGLTALNPLRYLLTN